MAVHDFRYSLLNPQHTLSECRALSPGRYQVTGNGGSIRAGDTLLVTLRGSRDLHMELEVEKVRHLIKPAGQWLAVTRGPVFGELSILDAELGCDSCGKQQAFQFAVDASKGASAREAAATQRIAELGWLRTEAGDYCPQCRKERA